MSFGDGNVRQPPLPPGLRRLHALPSPQPIPRLPGKPGQRADPAGPWSGWSIESVAARTSSPIFLGLILLMNSPLSIDVQGVGKNRQAGAQLAHRWRRCKVL
ncbi:unnamed protein product [Miscanthus lutarioriparius]|uniref:Uncharacterized protein n=1 Tax=Miscanthus lutarioriparius TaxID=422564 RepID=A0A811R9Y4_9POAL|nr:unnamed protein product [Miscanthus lutarioriparius]